MPQVLRVAETLKGRIQVLRAGYEVGLVSPRDLEAILHKLLQVESLLDTILKDDADVLTLLVSEWASGLHIGP